MTSTVATPVSRSWAQIVHAETANEVNMQKGLKPAKRGSLLRFCRGEVLKMMSNFGWLIVYGDVDHPSVEKHGGDVYIHKDDIVESESLAPGDIVTFYLYADDKGLGAEECRVEKKAASCLNVHAAEFVPSYAECSLHECAEDLEMATTDELVDIDEVADVYSRLNAAFFASDSDSDDSDSDEDLCHTWKEKRGGAPSMDGSTSGGATSDSEEEMSSEDSDSETEVTSEILAKWTKRLPLGMPLPLHFRPPPGLEDIELSIWPALGY